MAKSRTKPRERPLVGVAVDAVMGHGRSVLRGVMEYANISRRWLIHEEFRIETMKHHWPRCDGSIVVTTDPKILKMIGRVSRYVVNCAGGANPDDGPVVRLNDVAVGRMAAQHLIDCQLRHFGYYGRMRGSRVSDNRLHGFSELIAEKRLTCSVSPVDWPESYDWSDRHHWPQLIGWLRGLPKPVGVLAMDDTSAHDLAAACVEANLAVPQQIAIIGVNNDDLLCNSAWPPLSSVATEPSRLGFKAAELLDELITKGRNVAPRVMDLMPVGVVTRASTDTLAIEDQNVAEAVRYIREHACEDISVPNILRHVPVNRRWLERQFVQHLGRTLHDEIIRVRIEMAKRMLLAKDARTSEVAERCGFGAVQTFGRQFLQHVGQSPGKWRTVNRLGAMR